MGGTLTIGNVVPSWASGVGGIYNEAPSQFKAAMQALQGSNAPMHSGTRPIVVCGAKTIEAKDLDDAQAIAEREAHSQGADAYILKPVRKVAPKRDVVTTDLA